MAPSDEAIHAKLTERFVNQAVTRYVLPAVCSIFIAFVGFVGVRVLNQQDHIQDAILGLQLDMAVVKTDVKYLKQTSNLRTSNER